jgi:hypothetical protein
MENPMDRYKTNRLIMRGLLAAGVITMAVAASEVTDSEQVSKLLSDAKTQAYQLREDAATMDSYSRANVGWEIHAVSLDQIKQHINESGRTLAKLDENRSSASPWQATAIDRIKPLLKEIAANTQNAIQTLNGNPKQLSSPDYKEYLETNSDVAAQLAGLIRDLVDYGNTKNRMERLKAKLELPGK